MLSRNLSHPRPPNFQIQSFFSQFFNFVIKVGGNDTTIGGSAKPLVPGCSSFSEQGVSWRACKSSGPHPYSVPCIRSGKELDNYPHSFFPPPQATTNLFSLWVWFFLLLLSMFFKVPHISEIMQYLSFSLWFISLSKIPSRSSHSVSNGKIAFFLWQHNILLCKYTISSLSVHPLTDS